MSGGEIIKKIDIIIILSILVIGVLSLMGVTMYENQNSTGNLYAKVIYKNEVILMIDLETSEYKLYDTEYSDDVFTERWEEGIFYVPGSVTTDMSVLYEEDEFARDNQIVGIRLEVKNQKISVTYQESPLDICQLQEPTDSHLRPIVCLPNELAITVYTNLSSDSFEPDTILE